MSFRRVGERARLTSGATALRPKCLIVATSISLASFFSPVSASASPTGQAIEEVVSSAGSTVTAVTGDAPSGPPTSVPSVPTPTPPAKIPVPSQQRSAPISLPPASHVPNSPNSVGSVRSELVQVGEGSGNVTNGVGTQTPRPSLSLTPVGHDPVALREHPHPAKALRQFGNRVSTKRNAKAVPPRWIARVWPAVALWSSANQRTQPGGGNDSPSADFFEIPGALPRFTGLASPGTAPRVGSVPSVRSETPDGSLLPPTTVAPSADWAVILFGTMGLLFLVTITPWFRGTR
jgi:hypothetical protein